MTPSQALCYNKYSGDESLHTFDSKELQVRGGTESFISHIRETQTTEGTA